MCVHLCKGLRYTIVCVVCGHFFIQSGSSLYVCTYKHTSARMNKEICILHNCYGFKLQLCIFMWASTCKRYTYTQGKKNFFLLLLPLGVAIADLLPRSRTIPIILVCGTTPLHVPLHYIHESPPSILPGSSMCKILSLSTISPLHRG